MPKTLLYATLAVSLGSTFVSRSAAQEAPATVTTTGTTWTLENEVVRVGLSFAQGTIQMTSFFGKEAQREFLSGNAPRRLFTHRYGSADISQRRRVA